MRFEPHPILPDAWCARAGKFSFIVMPGPDGWELSYMDQVKGGSASSTREGPFGERSQAESRCRHLYKQLKKELS